MNKCLTCSCYDEDYGCTCLSLDKRYACPIESAPYEKCSKCSFFSCIYFDCSESATDDAYCFSADCEKCKEYSCFSCRYFYTSKCPDPEYNSSPKQMNDNKEDDDLPF